MARQGAPRRSPAPTELVFMALGGIGEIGMNCYLYGLGPADARQWLMIDLGITFPEGENDPGIDVILPDLRFIEEERGSLAGLVLTHAHEDHLGAVIELWPRLRCRSMQLRSRRPCCGPSSPSTDAGCSCRSARCRATGASTWGRSASS
jgi:mRNA degradation ribonuclease J1/J2